MTSFAFVNPSPPGTVIPTGIGIGQFSLGGSPTSWHWEMNNGGVFIPRVVTFYTDPTSGTITAAGTTKANGATGTYASGAQFPVHVVCNPPSG
jgi:hypothetical protein